MPNYQDRYQSSLELLKDVEMLCGSSIRTPVPIVEPRSSNINRLIITQGEEVGKQYRLSEFLDGKRRMIRVGRSPHNDIVLKDNVETYVSRYHFTIEHSSNGQYWTIRDGQWLKDAHKWGCSTNGTYLNASPVTQNGQRLYTGDIITAGEFKLKIE